MIKTYKDSLKFYLCLEAREQVDEERMTHGVGDFKDAFFAQQRLDLVSRNDVTFFQCLDRKVFASVSVLRQNNFAKVSATEHAQQAEAVESHALHLRMTSRLVSAVTILQAPRGILLLALLTVVHVMLWIHVDRRRWLMWLL